MKTFPSAFLVALFISIPTRADIKLPPIFSDHMVLQQQKQLPIWGWAEPGEAVSVSIGEQNLNTTAGADGKWMVNLTPLKVGAAPDMIIKGKSNSITIKDILVGEVWIGSGQSNMVFPVAPSGPYGGLLDADDEVKTADFPEIRVFTGASATSYELKTTDNGSWQICSPATAGKFSAVAFLFAKNLHQELKVPVGMVVVAFGASTAEAWISRPSMLADPILKPMVDGLDASEEFFKKSPSEPLGKAPIRPTPINKPRNPNARQNDPARDQHEPTVLFNAMIHPILGYAMRGVIWYQGESICGGDAGLSNYGHVQNAVVLDWRKQWNEGDFPFYVVQLPGQKNISNNPRVREQQAKILDLPNTGLAVAIDIGDPNNVHPRNKVPLGQRLSKIAFSEVYGRKLEDSGPMFKSMKAGDGSIALSFTHIGGGLVAKGGALKWFQIAGADQKFVDADAKIDGSEILVSSPSVKTPVAVRYAWDNDPEGCNLYNAEDLPAAPFRTDDWKYPIEGLVE